MSLKTKTPAQRPGRKTKNTHAKPTRTKAGCKCPQCGASMSMQAIFLDEWLPELHMLAARHGAMGITPDLASLCLCQGYGLYLFLVRQGG